MVKVKKYVGKTYTARPDEVFFRSLALKRNGEIFAHYFKDPFVVSRVDMPDVVEFRERKNPDEKSLGAGKVFLYSTLESDTSRLVVLTSQFNLYDFDAENTYSGLEDDPFLNIIYRNVRAGTPVRNIHKKTLDNLLSEKGVKIISPTKESAVDFMKYFIDRVIDRNHKL